MTQNDEFPKNPEPETSGDTSVDAGGSVDAQGDADELDPRMLDLLVCPMTKQRLTYDAEAKEFVSEAARLAYPVRGGVPILLPSEARTLETPTGVPSNSDEA